jgi:hypothetical protein
MPETTSSLYIGLMATLKQRLTAPDFLERHRQSVKDFTRQRCLPFVTVVLFLLNLVKRPLQDELDQFFNLEGREDYKVLKLRVEVENWSGKSTLAVYQDFHAKVFTSNLAAILAQQSQSKQYTYQVNFAHLLSKMKDAVVFLLRCTMIEDILDSLWQTMLHVVEPIRPGRSYPRKKTGRSKRFSMNYKPLC